MHLIQVDPWLRPYHQALVERQERFRLRLEEIESRHKDLYHWANGHLYFGFHRGVGPQGPENRQVPGTWYREWAPSAHHLSLIGTFNHWNPSSHPLKRKVLPNGQSDGVWEIFIPDENSPYGPLRHGEKVKVQVASSRGIEDRIPLYIRRVIQDPQTLDFSGQIWNPSPFVWSDHPFLSEQGSLPFPPQKSLRIYEAHVGMSLESGEVATFAQFEKEVLPRIIRGKYNVLQLMAIMEHPYYGSFGYHVANFFAVSSRFGTPEDLKSLINKAHQNGIRVFLDLVHSHAASNTREGLFGFDGSEDQFFHKGPRGHHCAWDSKLFDYGKPEVQHFLLSNIKYWLEEFHFDGFRFDGVTSMLYRHHGYGIAFNHYDRYFHPDEVDCDAIVYLQLANTLIKNIKSSAISIAEDVSGMPGLAAPIEDGGVGFDYRLAMGIPDFWINMLTQTRDEDWNCAQIFQALTNRRADEKHIAYVESHDQSLVGDKTLIFRMADNLMYQHMHVDHPHELMERAIRLSNVIKLLTATCGGEGYLNFIGNEFGHPEWVDFPREGNQWSYQYARRQWSLADNADLRYHDLLLFDRSLQTFLSDLDVICKQNKKNHIIHPELVVVHEDDKILTYQRGGFLFVFNLHVFKNCRNFGIDLTKSRLYESFLAQSHIELIPKNLETPSIALTTIPPFLQEHQDSNAEFACTLSENQLRVTLPHRSGMVLKMWETSSPRLTFS